eukprot:CAMPEP_0170242076 /NCGR_PEP_ID=MMETSP0116_2-20130129/20809_1 /TAXON_ID=400756 /ORGANISM="Durinskia baltica, Strain CSIRO CS-38" /LENGTH=156 /DNA_ID=CAMNT_0010492921 /DNA_START=81 /DNA_END=547 /DNA_ORIENTATION=-
MALASTVFQAVLLLCAAATSVAQSMRGAAEAGITAAAEYPMTKVPTNQNSGLAIASMVSAIVVPFVALVIMMWLKEKAWWGACYLIGGVDHPPLGVLRLHRALSRLGTRAPSARPFPRPRRSAFWGAARAPRRRRRTRRRAVARRQLGNTGPYSSE